MSYDLAVFDPRDELRDPSTFRSWYVQRVKWEGIVHFDEAPKSTDLLQAWFRDMAEIFPPMNGLRRPPFEDTERWNWVADYSFTTDLIHVGFLSAQQKLAYDSVYRLAARHRVGFYDVSGSPGEVWFPTRAGGLEVVHAAGH